MDAKEMLLTVGTSLFVCAGTLGVIAFVGIYYFVMQVGE